MQFVEAERERYAEDGKPPLEWTRYLELVGELRGLDGEVRERALGAHDLDGETWTRAEQYWLLTFALDQAQGQTDRVEAYGRASARPATTNAEKPKADLTATTEPAETSHGPLSHELANLATSPLRVSAGEAPPSSEQNDATPKALGAAPNVALPEVPTFLRAAAAPVAPPPVSVVYARPTAPPALVHPPERTYDALPVHREPALPFGATPSADYAARLATPATPATPAAGDRPDATVVAAVKGPEPTLPFAGAPARPPTTTPALTVQQHAMLSAELSLELEPAARAAVLARHGVERPEVLTALDAEWQARLQAEPAMMAVWKATYAQHRRTQTQQRRR